jgi:hypothetical protein
MKKLHLFSIGRSGCPVSLVHYGDRIAILKENLTDVDGILRIDSHLEFPKAKVYTHTQTSLMMEYIDGVSIKTYLEHSSDDGLQLLIDYIKSYFDYCVERSQPKDFEIFIRSKINDLVPYIDLSELNIKTNLLSGITHGDFTFDNLIFKDGIFYMIDLTPSENGGIHFDANKLRQDLSGFWFIRNEKKSDNIKKKCDIIYNELNKNYSTLFDDAIYQFMFARVLPYCQNDTERDYIIKTLSR